MRRIYYIYFSLLLLFATSIALIIVGSTNEWGPYAILGISIFSLFFLIIFLLLLSVQLKPNLLASDMYEPKPYWFGKN